MKKLLINLPTFACGAYILASAIDCSLHLGHAWNLFVIVLNILK